MMRPNATDVIDRLCHTMTHDRTCSVGFVTGQPGERGESLIARAGDALYLAKAQCARPPSTSAFLLKRHTP